MACKKLKIGCIDKALIAGVILGIFLSAVMCMTVLRRDLLRNRMYMYDEEGTPQRMHAAEHLGIRRGEFEEVDCTVEEVEESNEEVECKMNERGEWCASRPEAPMQAGPMPSRDKRSKEGRRGHHGGHSGESHEGRDRHDSRARGEHHSESDDVEGRLERQESHAEQRPEGHGSRGAHHRRGGHRFKCAKTKVSFKRRIEEAVRQALAYENTTTMRNFPGCSFSRCGENEERNNAEVDEARREWMAHKTAHMPARCYVNKNDPNQVILMSHKVHFGRFARSCGFHAAFWPFVFALVCAFAVIVRRFCCQNADPTNKKVLPANAAQAYAVPHAPTSGHLEKEREAFGLPPVSIDDGAPPNAPSNPKRDFLVLVPPSYAEVMNPKALVLPPEYVARLGEQKSQPVDSFVTPVE